MDEKTARALVQSIKDMNKTLEKFYRQHELLTKAALESARVLSTMQIEVLNNLTTNKEKIDE